MIKLIPRKSKYQKMHKGRNRGMCLNSDLLFSPFGLQAITRGRITVSQLEAGRKCIVGFLKRIGKLRIRVFPDKPITQKPIEVRMGKGKGNVEYWVSLIKPGKIIYELSGVSEELARKSLKLASAKLPVKTTFILKMENL
ncbi:50S ribosomal protein L16 [Buchnera aphidicola]|uniref:50S ribosomal protein L16 n=1 Tax=Buchnera aphidicola TaxID=9 RepID=UPI002093C8EC|nr:50S ribosomal protein L16 [Buchnera aphidicola]USS94078.1 50S ribosomal protein L16 [Buchnera aphidicola (Sipha maydis)]WII23623.1 50S ribosomal protein L16 [Buchnera aphidicola (Sipha maydis)]